VGKRVAFAAWALSSGVFVLGACASLVGYDDLRLVGGAPDTTVEAEVTAPADIGDSEGATDAAPVLAHPPGRPLGEAKPSGKGQTLWFAVRRYWLGSQNAARVPSDDAWRAFGFDIDHRCTSLEDSTLNIRSCLRVAGAKASALTDGDGCRDNNFGQHVVAMVKVAAPDFETKLESNVLAGQATLLLALDDVDEGADDPYVPARLYTTNATLTAPSWDETDERVIASNSVVGDALTAPITSFPLGYLVGDTWVSGEPASFFTLIPVAEKPAPLPLQGGVVTVRLGADRKGGTLGMLAGGVRLVDLEPLLAPIAIGAGLCPGTPFYTSAVASVKTFADLVAGAKWLQDEAVTCNMLSIGVGLDVVRVAPATKVEPPPPPRGDKCGDAG